MTTIVAESILEIFRKHKIPAGGVLYPRHISASVHLWDSNAQDSFATEMAKLIQDGHVARDGDTYRLTQKGYNHLYRHYTLQDTMDLILSDFQRRRIGKNDILLLPALLATLQDADRFHFDHYEEAVRQLAQRGWIASNGRGFILTEDGYREVYPE